MTVADIEQVREYAEGRKDGVVTDIVAAYGGLPKAQRAECASWLNDLLGEVHHLLAARREELGVTP